MAPAPASTLTVTRAPLQVFDALDVDGSGSIDYRELNKQLRIGAGSNLDPSLAVGAAGEIQVGSRNKSKLRDKSALKKRGSVVQGGVDLSTDVPIQQQLREILFKNAVRHATHATHVTRVTRVA